MWLAFVMAIAVPVGADGRGMIGPFKTQTECQKYLDRNRTTPADYCAEPTTEYQRLSFGKLD